MTQTAWKRKMLSAMAGAISIQISAQEQAVPPPDLSASKAHWAKSITLRGALGYKDNILLNQFDQQSSPFWLSSAEFFVLREKKDLNQIMVFGSIEDRHYFSADRIDKEQLATSQAEFKQQLGENWEAGLTGQYVYLDQVLDVSITESIAQAVPVKAHVLSAAPFAARKLPWGMRLEARFEVERQFVAEPLDDYWEGGPKLALTRTYGNRSELFAHYSYRDRAYDSRRQFDLTYVSLPDTSLRFDKHTIEAGVKHYWDTDRHWRTTARGTWERNQDNGPGFYDFNKWKAALQLAYSNDRWEMSAQGRYTRYAFDQQPTLAGASTVLNRDEWTLNTRLRRTVYKTASVFVETEHEWVTSNLNLEEYEANTYMAGIEWEF
jgi:hypothetical protein